jgi:hypothetical protein
MGTIDDALASTLRLGVHSDDLMAPVPDTHLAGRNSHSDAFADKTPWH